MPQSAAATQSETGQFLPPWTAGANKDYSDNKNYAVGVKIITEWDAAFRNATITLWQDNHPRDAQGGPSVILQDSYNQSTWAWTVSYQGLDPAVNNVFYFSVTQADGSDSFTSHYFNISDAVTTTTSPTTVATGSASSTSPSTVSPSTTEASASAMPHPTSPAAPASNNVVLSAGAIAGMVVGIVAGCLLLIGVAGWAWKAWRRRRTDPRAQQQPNVVYNRPYMYEELGPRKKQAFHVHESAGTPIHELHETMERPMPELHGSVGQPRHEVGGW